MFVGEVSAAIPTVTDPIRWDTDAVVTLKLVSTTCYTVITTTRLKVTHPHSSLTETKKLLSRVPTVYTMAAWYSG